MLVLAVPCTGNVDYETSQALVHTEAFKICSLAWPGRTSRQAPGQCFISGESQGCAVGGPQLRAGACREESRSFQGGDAVPALVVDRAAVAIFECRCGRCLCW